jgi:hypothetical protein
MESTLIIPRERPPTLSELKQALLTYDRVYLASPDDRELIYPLHYMAASSPGAIMPMGMNVGKVRPLGKVEGYDDYFQYLLDKSSDAIKQESLVVLDAPPLPPERQFTIGAPPLPQGWQDPIMVYQIYRTMAASPEFIGAISRGLDYLAIQSIKELDDLAPTGADDGQFSQKVNGQQLPSLPPQITYPGFVSSNEELLVYTKLCLARLGSVVKNFVRCRDLQLVPYTGDLGMASTMQMISKNCANALNSVSEGDSDNENYLRRLRIFDNLVVSEYIPDKVIDQIQVGEILTLRSKAWGKEKVARRILTSRLKELSLDVESDEEFEKTCKAEIDEYRKTQGTLESELTQFRIRLLCGVGLGSCGIPAGIELAQRMFSLSDLGSILAAGGVCFKLLKDNAPAVRKFLDESKNAQDLSGYALFRTYRPFEK